MFYVQIPKAVFKVRQQTNDSPGFMWQDVTTDDMFKGKRNVLIAMPGAFTPTCSSTHLPGYEIEYNSIKALGIDEVYALSVNDSFVMDNWFKTLDIENVKAIPDGSGDFTRKIGMMVKKDNLGFGMRSWRYSAVINDGLIEQWFIEPGMDDNVDGDPFMVSDVTTMLRYLEAYKKAKEEAEANDQNPE